VAPDLENSVNGKTPNLSKIEFIPRREIILFQWVIRHGIRKPLTMAGPHRPPPPQNRQFRESRRPAESPIQ
jgi:hypothetical protein